MNLLRSKWSLNLKRALISRSVISLLILLLSGGFAIPASAQTDQQLVDYLNNDYAQKTWPAIKNLVANTILSKIGNQLYEHDFNIDREDTSFDMNTPPGFTLLPNGQVHARFPATGVYHFDIDLNWEGTVDVHVSVDFSLEGDIGAAGSSFPPPNIHVTVVGHDITRQVIPDNINDVLSALQLLRFDSSVPLTAADPHLITEFSGARELDRDNAIDILFVSDGFTMMEQNTFEDTARLMAASVMGSDGSSSLGSRPSSDPYVAFHTNFRFWTLWSPINDSGEPSQRVIVQAAAPGGGGNAAAPSNLALLAKMGLRAQNLGSKIIVFVGKAGAAPLSTHVRANTYSYLVFFPSDNSPAALNHELGHTFLGELADEYGTDDPHQRIYRGLEPTYRNVSTNTWKWHWWNVNNQAWRHGTRFFPMPGALYANYAIFRPSAHCLMHGPEHMSEGFENLQFCEVCRAAVTRGIRRTLNGNGVLVEFEYLAPFRAAARRTNVRSSTGVAVQHMEAYDGTWNGGRTSIRMKLLANTLPKPWAVRWQVVDRSGHIVETVQQSYDSTTPPQPVMFHPELGFQIVLQITSNYLVPADTGSWRCANLDCSETIAPFRVEFHMDVPRRGPAAPPSPPTDLQQSPIVGSLIPITYDAQTGAARMAPLTLSARAGGYADWTFPVETEFFIQGPSMNNARFNAALGETVRFSPGPMLDGPYTWSVRSVFGSLASAWVSLPPVERFDLDTQQFQVYHFRIQRQFARNPVPPVAPVNLQVHQSDRGRRVISLSATSWDLNGDRLRLEFEVRPAQQNFTNVPTHTTNWLSGTLDSLRVTDGIGVGPLLSQHKWQVRAKDETGRASNWVFGGTIISLP